jgi:hypothetical protein
LKVKGNQRVSHFQVGGRMKEEEDALTKVGADGKERGEFLLGSLL